MLHTETVEAGTLALIRKLSADDKLKDFVLVGGTALSLQLGHRKSIDIDLFSAKAFDAKGIASHLQDEYDVQIEGVLGNAIFLFINDIKTDFVAHQYPWIDALQDIEGIRMASLEEIGAMKLHAIVSSGTRLKDYVDMFFLLEQHSLDRLTSAYAGKYPDSNAAMAKNALLYHKDIRSKGRIELIDREFNWPEIRTRLREAVINPRHVFQSVKADERKVQKNEKADQSKARTRSRRR